MYRIQYLNSKETLSNIKIKTITEARRKKCSIKECIHNTSVILLSPGRSGFVLKCLVKHITLKSFLAIIFFLLPTIFIIHNISFLDFLGKPFDVEFRRVI
jgi:hypothetical protein